MKRFFPSILVCGLMAAPIAAYGEQVSTPPARSPDTKVQVENFGDWLVRCFPVKSPMPCDIYFATANKQTHQRVTSVSIAFRPAKNQYMGLIAVPLGVSLADGLSIKTRTYTSPRMQFRRCDGAGCYVETEIAGSLINALNDPGNTEAALVVTPATGTTKPVSLMVGLNGFHDAFAAMVNQARQKATEP